MPSSSQTTPATEPVEDVSTIDLTAAADKIRPANSALADLLEAVQEATDDAMHSVTEYPGSAPECVDECPPCVAQYAAQVVAAEYLAGAR